MGCGMLSHISLSLSLFFISKSPEKDFIILLVGRYLMPKGTYFSHVFIIKYLSGLEAPVFMRAEYFSSTQKLCLLTNRAFSVHSLEATGLVP